MEYAFMKGAIENQWKHDRLVRNATTARRNVMAKVLADSQERLRPLIGKSGRLRVYNIEIHNK